MKFAVKSKEMGEFYSINNERKFTDACNINICMFMMFLEGVNLHNRLCFCVITVKYWNLIFLKAFGFIEVCIHYLYEYVNGPK